MRRNVTTRARNFTSDSRKDVKVSPLSSILLLGHLRQERIVGVKKHPKNVKCLHRNKDVVLDIF